MQVQTIKINKVSYPLAYNMLAISRIMKDLGSATFDELVSTIDQIMSHANGTGEGELSPSKITEVLQPMGVIAHHGLHMGGYLSNKPYTKDENETQCLFNDFKELAQCFGIFYGEFLAFYSPKEEDAAKKKTKVSP